MVYNEKKRIPLIITCSLVPQIKVYLNDTDERLRQYRESIIKWVESRTFSDIIIIDNTGNDIFTRQEIKHLESDGVSIEQLKYGPEDQVQYKGASWGVARIYQYALENSRLIKDSEFFATTTGRTFVGNVNTLLADFNPNDNKTYVNRWLSKGYKRFSPGRADIRFAIYNKHFFESNLAPLIDKLNDFDGKWIEILYDEVFSKSSQIVSFKSLPKVIGQAGHEGGFYDGTNSLKWFIKDLIGKITKASSYTKF